MKLDGILILFSRNHTCRNLETLSFTEDTMLNPGFLSLSLLRPARISRLCESTLNQYVNLSTTTQLPYSLKTLQSYCKCKWQFTQYYQYPLLRKYNGHQTKIHIYKSTLCPWRKNVSCGWWIITALKTFYYAGHPKMWELSILKNTFQAQKFNEGKMQSYSNLKIHPNLLN